MPNPQRPDPKTPAPRNPAGDEPSLRELQAMWSLHRLQEPTFDDLTKGLCLGLVWCMALWTPMFLSALT